MKTRGAGLTALLILGLAFHAQAGALSFVAISPTQSDVNSGIGSENQYTSAVEGGNASSTPRVINGITLYPLAGSGQSVTANNCVVNALSGNLANVTRPDAAIPADGTIKEVLSDMIVNQDAGDNSQQEIVLDPASLTAGTTYDLRIYIASSGAQDREVNLSFVGDGQAPAETGFFNEEDARTSSGAFRDPNQVYYINYRFTWDGSSTPGVTVTQKSGQAPFTLYALTNQAVIEQQAAAPAAPAPEVAGPAPAPAITTAQVSAVPDQLGVTSDTFYSHPSLKKHGRWIEVKKYGRCWQPTDAPADWRPYSRGHFVYSDDGGYTWISDSSEEDWGWACYHYGRWCRVRGVGSGWAWVPGTAWSGAWVSWRQSRDRAQGYVGWAPLPPEATLRVGVGISTWADREYDIGPDYYTFVNVRDFGADSYERPGLIVDRRRSVELISQTVNITNINYTDTHGNVSNVSITQVRAYNGGPDFTFINTQIREQGGREIPRIRIDRVGAETFTGGTGRRFQNNTLVVFAPPVVAEAKPKALPKVVATVPDSKIDHGWADLKDPKLKAQLKNQIAEQTQGQTPTTTKAVLPPQVLQATAPAGTSTQSPPSLGPSPSPITSPSTPTVAGTSPAPSVVNSPPTVTTNASAPPVAAPRIPAKDLHPGEKVSAAAVAAGSPAATPSGSVSASPAAGVTSSLSAEQGRSPAAGKVLHPGQKVTSAPNQSPVAARTAAAAPSPTIAAPPALATKQPTPTTSISPAQTPIHPITAASATPVTAAQSPAPRILHPGQKLASPPAQTPAPAVAGASALPTVAPQRSPVVAGQSQRQQLAAPPTATPLRAAVTEASPSVAPTIQRNISRQEQQRIQKNALPTAAPVQTQPTGTPPQPAITTRRTPPPPPITTQSPVPMQTPAVTTRTVAPTITGRQTASPTPSGPSQQQVQQQRQQELQQQQAQQAQQKQQQAQQAQRQAEIERRMQQQADQKKQEQLEQQVQQQQQKKALQEQAQQKQQQELQQKQAQEKTATQAEQKRQLQQQQAQQAEQERKLQQQAEQKKQEQAQRQQQQQQLKQQELKAAQQAQEKERQRQLQQQQQQQQQIEQRIRQQQQQKQQEQAEQKQQQQQLRQQQLEQQQAQQRQLQQQQQNRRAATPTPSPGQ